MDTSSGDRLAGPSAQCSSPADRIMAVCPGCQATLSVRREYIGNDVQCKQCRHIFPIVAPADIQSKPHEHSGHEQPFDEHGRLMVAHGQIQLEYDLLEVEDGPLASARDELREQQSPVTSELNTIPLSSGEPLVGLSAQPSNRADRIVVVCPRCRATLSMRRAYIGSDVNCKHCGHKFPIAAPANTQSKPVEDSKQQQLLDEHAWLMALYGELQPKDDQFEVEHVRLAAARDELGEQIGAVTSELNAIRTSSGERLAAPSAAERPNQADRIVAACPGCQATLRVRRAYVGSDVKCKHCGHIFPIAAPAETQSEPVEDSKHEHLLDEQDRLMAAHGQLQAKYDQLEAENVRLTTAQNQLGEQHSRVTNELNAIRAELGSLAPADVRSLVEEQESRRTELQRLREENGHLSIELDTARAECNRLTRELKTAADEIKALQMTLAERDRAERDPNDQRGA